MIIFNLRKRPLLLLSLLGFEVSCNYIFILAVFVLPVSQRIFTPPRIWIPRSKSASGFGPPGPNPLADLYPSRGFGPPLRRGFT